MEVGASNPHVVQGLTVVLFKLFYHHRIGALGYICGMKLREGYFESFSIDVFGYTEKGKRWENLTKLPKIILE